MAVATEAPRQQTSRGPVHVDPFIAANIAAIESGSKHFPVARFTAILKPESGVLKRVSATKNLASTSWARGHTSLVATMLGSVDNNDF